jgi:hypothetical protein
VSSIPVTLFCPVCCSPVEEEVSNGTAREFSCGVCGQDFHLEVDLERLAKFSAV